MLQISKNGKTLCRDGKPFFYLADTCWSAFTNITDDEWDYYLYKRKVQGFNTIQINILHINVDDKRRHTKSSKLDTTIIPQSLVH